MNWRDRCRPIIAKVISDNPGLAGKDLRAKLRAAYPFNMRANWPYKVWLDEVRVQLGLKTFKAKKKGERNRPAVKECKGQSRLFSRDEALA